MATRPLRICKLGSSAAVVIPKPLLEYLRWQVGDLVVVDLLDDRTIRFRPPTARDLAPERVKPFLTDTPPPVTP